MDTLAQESGQVEVTALDTITMAEISLYLSSVSITVTQDMDNDDKVNY